MSYLESWALMICNMFVITQCYSIRSNSLIICLCLKGHPILLLCYAAIPRCNTSSSITWMTLIYGWQIWRLHGITTSYHQTLISDLMIDLVLTKAKINDCAGLKVVLSNIIIVIARTAIFYYMLLNIDNICQQHNGHQSPECIVLILLQQQYLKELHFC